MYFSTEQLETLGYTGAFQPSRLNDHRRLDLTDRPFMAIDPPNPWEIDDAIRVNNRRQGGFVVQVAVAEGWQVNPDDRIVSRAIRRRSSHYGPSRYLGSMLPLGVCNRLELSEGGPRRALVISQEFTADTEPTDCIQVEPAQVVIKAMDYLSFGDWYLSQAETEEAAKPVVAFNKRFRSERRLPYRPPSSLEDKNKVELFGQNLVQTYMVLANLAAARWCGDNDVPILYRQFGAASQNSHEQAEAEVIRATYTPQPGGHVDVARYSRIDTPYTHVTSPLRRAADLVNHMQIGAQLADGDLPFSATDLLDISQRLRLRHFSGTTPPVLQEAVAS